MKLVAGVYLVTLCAACSGRTDPDATEPQPPTPVRVASVALTATPRALYRGARTAIAARAMDVNGQTIAGRTPTIASSDSLVLRIESGGGEATALQEGTAIITAVLDDVRTELRVEVLPVGNIARLVADSSLVMLRTYSLAPAVVLSNGDTVAVPLSSVRSSDTNVVVITPLGIRTRGVGSADVSIAIAGASGTRRVQVRAFEDRPLTPELAQWDTTAAAVISVIDLRIIPTRDGERLDSLASPNFYTLGGMSVDAMRLAGDQVIVQSRYGLEEGSRYRGSLSPTARKEAAFRIRRSIMYYRVPPASALASPFPQRALIDYPRLFAETGLLADINRYGATQVWITFASWDEGFPSIQSNPPGFDRTSARWVPESAMSNPAGLCVSNSFSVDCLGLPRANHTYVVYGVSPFRGWSCSVHNHGHQFERLFSHFDRDGIFLSRFATFGRAGFVHSPPNTTGSYDYRNRTLVEADLNDWRPTGGSKTAVNVDTWESAPYRYADLDNCGGRWNVHWFQSFPGRTNAIDLNGRRLENWWGAYVDFDAWVRSGRSLVSGAGTSQRAGVAASTSTLKLPVHDPHRDGPR